jgi:DnaK suppressor protein
MPKSGGSPQKSVSKTIARGVASVAKTAKKSAKKVLVTGRTLPPPVELEPRLLDSPALRALRKERRRLNEELKHQEMLAQDHPTTGNHMADDASEVEAQAKSLALRRHLEGMIKEIDRAIARAQKGTYGVCERCHLPISAERLQVMPSATFCIECAKLQIRSSKATTVT